MIELPQRFWAKVARGGPNDCWIWMAYKNADGYGGFGYKHRHVRAHRLMMASLGKLDLLDETTVVRHACDNPSCVNPAHLLVGTHADNVHDRDERNRGRWVGKLGEANPSAKLTEESVRNIRRAYVALPRYASGKVCSGALASLAEAFGIPYGTIRNIVDGYQWKGV